MRLSVFLRKGDKLVCEFSQVTRHFAELSARSSHQSDLGSIRFFIFNASNLFQFFITVPKITLLGIQECKNSVHPWAEEFCCIGYRRHFQCFKEFSKNCDSGVQVLVDRSSSTNGSILMRDSPAELVGFISELLEYRLKVCGPIHSHFVGTQAQLHQFFMALLLAFFSLVHRVYSDERGGHSKRTSDECLIIVKPFCLMVEIGPSHSRNETYHRRGDRDKPRFASFQNGNLPRSILPRGRSLAKSRRTVNSQVTNSADCPLITGIVFATLGYTDKNSNPLPLLRAFLLPC